MSVPPSRDNSPPVLSGDPAECCGCAAGQAVCPFSAITMEPDGEGFLHPRIDPARCIRCRRCHDACAFKDALRSGTGGRKNAARTDTPVFAARHKDAAVLRASTSGGVFTALSDAFLARGDALLCVRYDYGTHAARFRLALTTADRDAARGTMYMQSDPGDSWKEALAWLKANPGKRLLFVGLGCQTAAFARFAGLNGVRDRVLAVDLICHGAPSPLVWKDYIESLAKGEPVSGLDFRDKRNGWNRSTGIVRVGGREVSIMPYRHLYSLRYTLRRCCSSCPYTSMVRESDITIGDFWHLEKSMPDFADPLGTSLVLVHTARGRDAFDAVRGDLDVRPSNSRDCWQLNLERPTRHAWNRRAFWRDYRRNGIAHAMDKFSRITPLDRLVTSVRRFFRRA